MRFVKRKKSRRLRGSHTHGRGFKKKARGSGHRGGFGMAGTGKRGDQKKTMVLNLYGNDYFGKDRTLRRGHVAKKLEVINLHDISQRLDSFVLQGKAKESKGSYELDLSGYKILGEGNIHHKILITADAASKSAMEKVKKAGGSITVKIFETKKEEKSKNPKEKSE